MEESTSGTQMFLSYSRDDQEFVLELYEELRAGGLQVWIDQRDIPDGANWDESITQALKDCRVFVLMATANSVQSNNVADEVVLAKSCGKTLLFVLLEEIKDWGKLTLHAQRPQHVLAYDQHRASLTERLFASVRDEPDESLETSASAKLQGIAALPSAPTRGKPTRDALPRRTVLAIGALGVVTLLGALKLTSVWGPTRAAEIEEVPKTSVTLEAPTLLVRLAATHNIMDANNGWIELHNKDSPTRARIGYAKLSKVRAAALFRNANAPYPDLSECVKKWTDEDPDYAQFWSDPVSGLEEVELLEKLTVGMTIRVEFWHQKPGSVEPEKRRQVSLTLTPGLNQRLLSEGS